MEITLGRTIILVHDYNEALKFYEKIFECHVLFDQTDKKGQRLLHIGFNEKERAGIWFIKAEGEEQIQRVGRQTIGPALVFYTDDFDKMYQRIKLQEVTIKKEPIEAPEFRFMHFNDLYGNEIILVEMEKEEKFRNKLF